MSTFFCFLLAAFEAGGHRPQPLGLRTSEMACKRVQSSLLELPSAADIIQSREAFRLGVKPGGVALGLQTMQAVFMVFVFIGRIFNRQIYINMPVSYMQS